MDAFTPLPQIGPNNFGGSLGTGGTGSALDNPNPLPDLSSLPSIGDILGKIPPVWEEIPGGGIIPGIGNTISGAGKVLSWLTDPVRLVTVIIGLGLIFGGLFLFGTSQVADSIRANIKSAVA